MGAVRAVSLVGRSGMSNGWSRPHKYGLGARRLSRWRQVSARSAAGPGHRGSSAGGCRRARAVSIGDPPGLLLHAGTVDTNDG